jgi:hypothetical protein
LPENGKIESALVVFVSTYPVNKKIRVVGWYEEATVFEIAKSSTRAL